jgi:hypothetical protein
LRPGAELISTGTSKNFVWQTGACREVGTVEVDIRAGIVPPPGLSAHGAVASGTIVVSVKRAEWEVVVEAEPFRCTPTLHVF